MFLREGTLFGELMRCGQPKATDRVKEGLGKIAGFKEGLREAPRSPPRARLLGLTTYSLTGDSFFATNAYSLYLHAGRAQTQALKPHCRTF